jgi:hypothetical protein
MVIIKVGLFLSSDSSYYNLIYGYEIGYRQTRLLNKAIFF